MPPDSDIHISPNFSWHEMTRTTHSELQVQNRNVPPSMMLSANALCWGLLEPIRRHFRKPVVIHSGYRSPDLNAKVKGSKRSEHMQFKAADFHVIDFTIEDVWNYIWKQSELPFGQLILEPSWIHCSLGYPLREKHKSGQVKTYDGVNYELIAKVGG